MANISKTIKQLFPDQDTSPIDALSVAGLTSDSRLVEPGFLFAALAGSEQNGQLFAPNAVENGAIAILTGIDGLNEELGVPILRFQDPRRALALAAANFYSRQPQEIVAVTGTSGKTSVVSFLRQIWEQEGNSAASLGTLGVTRPGGETKGSLTTPDPVLLHQLLAELGDEGVTHLAMEASSHGLEQRRLDGVRLQAAAFTNLSRDHLDYHADMNEYLRAKLRLFDTLLPDDGIVVVDADQEESSHVREIAGERGLRCLTVGRNGDDVILRSVTRMTDGVRLLVEADDETHYVSLPLVGGFQVANSLVAAGLAIASGVQSGKAISALNNLTGVNGRLELVGAHPNGAPVFVDYSHKPEALRNVLVTLRDYAQNKLTVIFGAGGDRDSGKRPMMGEIASRFADKVVVTDDNPRTEDPAIIRQAILDRAPNAHEMPDRREAIRNTIEGLEAGDVLVIAGKGHESGQIVGDEVLPFSDQDEAKSALEDLA